MVEVIDRLKKQAERRFVQEFVMQQIGEAKIEASENFKQFLPPSAKPAAKPAPAKVDPKTKAGLMGHTDYAFTQSHYQSTDLDDLITVAVSME